MLKQIQHLEEKLAGLLVFVAQLQENNRQTRERVQVLETENQNLRTRMSEAKTQVDALIEQIVTQTESQDTP